MNDVWIRYTTDQGRSFVAHYEDVDCVHSDGQTLWVDTFSTQGVAIIPMKWVRDISGTPLALDT
jgi:hypothetical protein